MQKLKLKILGFSKTEYGYIFLNTISVVTALCSSIHNFDTYGLIITLTVRMLIWSYCVTALFTDKKGLKNIYFFLYCLIFVIDFWTLYW